MYNISACNIHIQMYINSAMCMKRRNKEFEYTHANTCPQRGQEKLKMADMQMVLAGEVEKKVEAQYVEMKVPLYSYGCERKIKKALAHLKGIYSIEVNFEEQKVTVWGICNKYDVLDTVRNKRKDALFWDAEDNLISTQQDNEKEAEEEEEKDTIAAQVGSSFSSSSFRRKAKRLVPPLGLIRCRSSLTWKAWKKVFIRSYSS